MDGAGSVLQPTAKIRPEAPEVLTLHAPGRTSRGRKERRYVLSSSLHRSGHRYRDDRFGCPAQPATPTRGLGAAERGFHPRHRQVRCLSLEGDTRCCSSVRTQRSRKGRHQLSRLSSALGGPRATQSPGLRDRCSVDSCQLPSVSRKPVPSILAKPACCPSVGSGERARCLQ